MVEQLDRSIARIVNKNGSVVGAGFLISEKRMLTCTHVVARALNLQHGQKIPNHSNIRLDFPLVKPGSFVDAIVFFWSPESDDDIAVLELIEFPEGTESVKLLAADNIWGHNFRAFGYPEKLDDGVWASGVMRGKQARGWIQVEDIKEPGHRVEQGYSGGPVWDENLNAVVGMIVATENNHLTKVAFVIPVSILARSWPELIEVVNVPVIPMGELFNVPELPSSFLPRSECIEAIKENILSEDKHLRIVGLHGMGGIGKSVLAATIAHNEDIRKRFLDGIIWLSIGPQSDLVARQLQLAKILGERQRGIVDVQDGRACLGELLSNRACLLILDDIWGIEQAAALNVKGQKLKILLTTRNAGIVKSLEAIEHRIGFLSSDDSLTLLALRSNQGIERLPEVAREVAKECGNLPLALAIVGSMVRNEPNEWENVLYRLKSADLDKIKYDFPDYPHPSLFRAIQVSIDALQQEYKNLYFDLAVFPEDTAIPISTLQILWAPKGFNKYDIRDTVRIFSDLSLAIIDEQGRLSLHDLLFDYIRKRANNLMGMHKKLVNLYYDTCKDGWASGPNDGYFFEKIAYNIFNAGLDSKLRKVLLDFRWLDAKLNATDVPNLILDYNYLISDTTLRSVRRAILLSVSALSRDKRQLPCQIYGRLIESKHPLIRKMLTQIKKETHGHWIRPLNQCLISPESSLMQTIVASAHCINDLAITSDGRKMISASEDGILKVWNVDSGCETKAIKVHETLVNSVAITQDGKNAISGSDDGTVRIWDLESGMETETLIGHFNPINAVAVFPDGHRVVSGSMDGILKIWDIRNGDVLKTLKGHAGPIDSIIIAENGKMIISASNDAIKIWNADQGYEIETIKESDSRITAFALFPDERRIIAASYDDSLSIWDLSSGEKKAVYSGNRLSKKEVVVCIKARYFIGHHFITDLAVTKDGSKIILSSSDGLLEVLTIDDNNELEPIKGYVKGIHDCGINAVILTPYEDKVISGSCDGTIRIWDLENDNEFPIPEYYSGSINAVALAPDGRKAVSATISGILDVWNLENFKKIKTLDCHSSLALETEESKFRSISSVTITPSGLIAFSYDKLIKILDLEKGIELKTLNGHANEIISIIAVPDGDKIISVDYDGTVKVWDIMSGNALKSIECRIEGIDVAAISPMGDKIIFASDKAMQIWDLENGRELIAFGGNNGHVNAVALSYDGLRAISGSLNGEIKIWDLRKGNLLKTFIGHTHWVEAVSITRDGKLAISVSHDRTLMVWDILNLKEIAAFQGDSICGSCAMAPDNITIIAGDDSGRIHASSVKTTILP